MAGFRAAPVILVADGQSLNFTPVPDTDNWPVRLCTNVGIPAPVNVWIGGTGWYTLLGTQQQRVRPYADAGLLTVYTMCGGTSDILANRTAAQIYADMVTQADAARAWGYDYVIGTTTTPFTGFTAPQETVRDDANVLILADADLAFDEVSDFSGTTGLHDPSNTTYYSDGLHFTSTAAELAADTMQATWATIPALAAALGI